MVGGPATLPTFSTPESPVQYNRFVEAMTGAPECKPGTEQRHTTQPTQTLILSWLLSLFPSRILALSHASMTARRRSRPSGLGSSHSARSTGRHRRRRRVPRPAHDGTGNRNHIMVATRPAWNECDPAPQSVPQLDTSRSLRDLATTAWSSFTEFHKRRGHQWFERSAPRGQQDRP